jgi:uncharacterized protein (DUF2384 family)
MQNWQRKQLEYIRQKYESTKKIAQEEFIDSWLDAPNPAFDNKTPRQMVIEQNTAQIEAILYRLESGIPD